MEHPRRAGLWVGAALLVPAALVACTPPAQPEPSPAAARPSASSGPRCPATGVRIDPGPVDAALGLRAVRLTLTNCGDKSYRLDGYPVVTLLGPAGEPIEVTVRHSGIEAGSPRDRPKKLSVRPGRAATAVMTWRNTVTDGVAQRPAFVV